MSRLPVEASLESPILRFGTFELDADAERLLKNGRPVPLQPQPFKLLHLLASRGGRLVSREEIRAVLWSGDTFVNFEQGVNFAMRQVRDALGEDADRPIFIQTVPKRGYRFLAPVDAVDRRSGRPYRPATDGTLEKILWTNIAELRLEETRRRRRHRTLIAVLAFAGAAVIVALAIAKFVL